MKRTLNRIDWAALLMGLSLATYSFAQTKVEPPPKAEEEEATEGEKTEGDKATAENEQEQLKRHIALVTKLHEKMGAKLELKADQKKTIHTLFQDHLKELKSAKARKKGNESETDKGDELSELREKLKEARASNDKEAINTIRAQMRDFRKDRRSGMRDRTSQFLKKVEEALSEDQRKPYRDIVRDLGLDFDGGSSGATIQQIIKVSMSDEVGLSEEQKQIVRDKLKDVILSMDPDTRDSGDLDEIAGQFRADVRKELTPAQWTKVEDLLKVEMEKQAALEKANAAPKKEEKKP